MENKISRYKIINGLALMGALCLMLNSCLKKFDPSSYAPDKPFGGYTSSDEIAPGNLIAFWNFNGSLKDSIGNLEATNVGTTFAKSGIKGEALNVGADHYLVFNNIGDEIPNLKSYTISFWMNATQNTSYAYGVFSLANSQDFWGNLDIYFDNGSSPDMGVFKVHMNNTNAKNTGQFQATQLTNVWNKWVQVAITYDSSTTITSSNFNIYLNGVSVYSALLKDTTNNYGPLKFANAQAMVIGTWQFMTDPSLSTTTGPQTWAGSFGGSLDEFRIYNKALTNAQVSSLYKLEKAGR